MSGTSADGVDVAIVDISARSVQLVAHDMFPYPPALRKSIFQLFQPQTARLDDICHFNFVLGEVFALAVLRLCKKTGVRLSSLDLIGSHGQTIYHNPHGTRFGRRVIASTLQIAEPSVIAQRLGVTTVADFRPRDIAAGGEGAPLVPYADSVLFRSRSRSRAIQNIGGIANVTYLPPRCRPDGVLAFDTGPGNMILDRLVSILTRGRQSFDRNGALASRGDVDADLLRGMLGHPFFRRRPPKSTGREQFGWAYADDFYRRARGKNLPPESILATAAAFTAASMEDAYRRFLPVFPDEVILCGGGVHNRTLVEMLRQRLAPARVILMDELGIPADAKEAISFAILAYAAVKGIPNNIPAATGARQAVILGKIIPSP